MYRNWNHDECNQVLTAGASALASHRVLLRSLIDSMLAVPGASLRYSCDSAVAGVADDGVDRLTDPATDLVWATGAVAHSWVVLRFENMGAAGYELMIACQDASADGSNLIVYGSEDAFTGGSTTVNPTATNSRLLGTDNSPFGAVNTDFVLHLLYSEDGDRFYFVVIDAASSVVVSFAAFGSVLDTWDGVAPVVGCWVAYTAGSAATFAALNVAAASEIRGRAVTSTPATVDLDLFMTCESWEDYGGGSAGTPAAVVAASTFSGRWPMFPVGLASTDSRFGSLPDIFYVSSAHDIGHILTPPDDTRWAVFDDIVLPWDASIPYIATTAPAETIVEAEIVGYTVGSGLRSLAPVVGELDPDANTARWTPIVISFDVPPGHHAVVTAEIGADSSFWFAAFESARIPEVGGVAADGWSPMFAGKSVATITGTVLGGRTFELSILPNGGWQRSNVSVVPYVAREVA